MEKGFLKTLASFFAFFCILFIPFPFNLIKIQVAFTDFLFGKLIGFVSKNIFGRELRETHVYSDSVSMYILVLLLFILSIIIAFLLWKNKTWQLHSRRMMSSLYQLFIYYLVLQILKYGADKIFKNQFYLPEPNTLYTPLGNISKDLLYWTAMGSSRTYTIFLGSIEVLVAIFIFIRRTRLIGLLMSFMILLNVIAVNFGFDISVKLFSIFLLFLNSYLLAPYIYSLFHLLHKKTISITPFNKNTSGSTAFLTVFFRWLMAGLICLEVLYPFMRTRNFNGDTAAKPYLHGAYEVKQMISGTDTLSTFNSPVKRFFIHRDGYMIFQNQADEMQDYKLNYDTANSVFILTDYDLKKTRLSFSYQSTDSSLTLQYFSDGKENILFGKAIDWRQLALLRKGFHWTVDGDK